MSENLPPDDKYLCKRPGSPNWQIRVPVPRELHACYGRREVWKSLGTTDLRSARKARISILAALHLEWERMHHAMRPNPQSLKEISRVAVTHSYEPMLEGLRANRRSLPDDDAHMLGHIEQRQMDLIRLALRKSDGKLAQWEAMADRIISRENLLIPKGSLAYEALVGDLAVGTIDALRVFNDENAGHPDPQPQSDLVREAISTDVVGDGLGGELLPLFDHYASQRLAEGRKREDVLAQDRKVIEMFSSFVGAARDITSITSSDVRQFRDLLRCLPPRWQHRKELSELSLRDAASKARALELPTRELTTVNKYLSTISPLFKWFINERQHMLNPCDGLFHSKVGGSNPRPPFTTAELNQILSSPLFTGFAKPGKEHVSGNVRATDWRYWIPLLSLFTGARVSEVAQLRADDLAFDKIGLPYLHIRHAPARLQWTKNGESRIALVDSRLIALGFRSLIDECAAKDMSGRLFPELAVGNRGIVGDRPSRFWRDYLQRRGLKRGRDGKGVHSFRHTLADRLREEGGMLNAHVGIALGHSSQTVTSGYGIVSERTIGVLREMFDKLTWDGVDFTPLGVSGTA